MILTFDILSNSNSFDIDTATAIYEIKESRTVIVIDADKKDFEGEPYDESLQRYKINFHNPYIKSINYKDLDTPLHIVDKEFFDDVLIVHLPIEHKNANAYIRIQKIEAN